MMNLLEQNWQLILTFVISSVFWVAWFKFEINLLKKEFEKIDIRFDNFIDNRFSKLENAVARLEGHISKGI